MNQLEWGFIRTYPSPSPSPFHLPKCSAPSVLRFIINKWHPVLLLSNLKRTLPIWPKSSEQVSSADIVGNSDQPAVQLVGMRILWRLGDSDGQSDESTKEGVYPTLLRTLVVSFKK